MLTIKHQHSRVFMPHGLRRSLRRDSLDSLLLHCSTLRQAKQIHAHLLLLSSSSSSSSFLFARLVSLYSSFGLLSDARSVFDAVPPSARTSLLCNSLLRANLFHCRPLQALSLYLLQMNSAPDSFTFPLVVRACSILSIPNFCTSIHTHVLVSGFQTHLHVANELVSMYANLGQMEIARKVFDGMNVRSVVSWNVLVSGYAANFDCEGAVGMFRRMKEVGSEPNSVTWTSLLSAHARCQRHVEVVLLFDEMRGNGVRGSAEAAAVALSVCAYLERGALTAGKKMHGYVVRNGFERYPFVRNSLVCMYGKLGCGEDAEIIFSETAEKSLVSWNALISSYAASGLCEKAYEVFSQLEKYSGVVPNVVSWSAVIGGFALAGMAESSLDMFRRMQQAGAAPNSVTIATVLSSCAELSALELGKEIHCHTIRSLMDQNILVGNGLLNMYAKSGSLKNGRLVFDRMTDRDLISWNTMITGFGMHGRCNEALATFEDMTRNGIAPDGVTFVAVLSACSHAGRVSDGRQLFHQMVNSYRLSPAMEHYSCMVDLLGRAGLLREASDIIEGMPFRPNACVVGALLNSCRIHGNSAVAEDCVARVLGIEGETGTGNYMLLSNIYAAMGNWGESAKVRVMTKVRGLKKQPGHSWIEVAKKVYVFSAAGSSVPLGAEEVCGVVEDLSLQMETENFVSEEDWFVLNTVEG